MVKNISFKTVKKAKCSKTLIQILFLLKQNIRRSFKLGKYKLSFKLCLYLIMIKATSAKNINPQSVLHYLLVCPDFSKEMKY